MVKTKIKDYWMCPYCDKKYEDEEEAKNCIQDCADLEYPIEIEVVKFICKYCNKEYDDDFSAESCEQQHKVKQDKYFYKYQIIKDRKILVKAASHKEQTKLEVEK